MGHTMFNLDSPADLSKIIYSREVINKKQWASDFNLGTEMKWGRRIPKRPHRYNRTIFAKLINMSSRVIPKSEVKGCPVCSGKGRIEKYTRQGVLYKNLPRCINCRGEGWVFVPIIPLQAAGLKVIPQGVNDVSMLGFTTNKEKLEELADHAETDQKEFLTRLVRYNAVTHSLSTAIDGVRRNIDGSGILHTNFMQCVTATGRLSSRDPNLHNQDRGKSKNSLPIRRVFVSRWEGGCITKGDFSQLEFRIAADLSGCEQAKEDILDGVDVHQRTADILTEAGQRTDRQGAKTHTFKPLYGGITGTDAEQTYYRAFLERYRGISAWHSRLCEQAVERKRIILPSGRIYFFPFAKRFSGGGVSGRTKIVNYPVQGFATADITPCAFVEVGRAFERAVPDGRIRSLLINEVHDDIVVDTYPGEEHEIAEILYTCMRNVHLIIYQKFNYKLSIPLDVEVSQGPNWLDTEEVKF